MTIGHDRRKVKENHKISQFYYDGKGKLKRRIWRPLQQSSRFPNHGIRIRHEWGKSCKNKIHLQCSTRAFDFARNFP